MSAPETGRPPRSVITEDALSVHPSLLGLPLARPWRRGAAMAIDGLLIAILAQAPGVLFALAAALLLFRASARAGTAGGYFRRSVRFGLRAAAAMIVFAVAITGWDTATDRFESGVVRMGLQAGEEGAEDGATAEVATSGRQAFEMATGFVALRGADDPGEARRLGEAYVAQLQRDGMGAREIEGILQGVADAAEEKPWLAGVVDSLVAGIGAAETTGAPAVSADSLAAAYASAMAAGDSAAASALRPALTVALAADTLGALDSRIAELDEERDRLRAEIGELEEASERTGVLGAARALADDLGLGLGWFILYFTAAVALWQGRTPGKRALGIRVVRLNAKPIGWWAAFERAGGYSAGVATGLLGFLQILWDRNRQAIHDKITETAVVMDR